MQRIEPAAWTDEDRALWARIAAHDFERPDAALTFAGRLARDHGWSFAEARAAIDAYRRFCFLAVRAGGEVTPSEEVDEVWHLHLTYTRDYWQVWCRGVLRRDLHHGPTRGGPAEGRRFAEQYAETLAAHEAWFGAPPPALWPGTEERFGRPRFRVVDRAACVVVPVPRGLKRGAWRLARILGLAAALALAPARPASATGLNPLDWTAGPFLALYAALAGAALAAAWTACDLIERRQPLRHDRQRFTPAELALMAAGARRAADVLILEGIAAGRIAMDAKKRRLGPFETDVVTLSVHGREVDRGWLASQREERVDELRRGLVETGLLLPGRCRGAMRLATLATVSPVVLLGLAKLVVGAERGKPVGILLLLLGGTALAAFALAEVRSNVSRAARALVEDHRRGHARALRAPRSGEAIEAFALAGAPALAGTALEPYARLLKGDDGGGCGGDGGCGGGGCGGCGS